MIQLSNMIDRGAQQALERQIMIFTCLLCSKATLSKMSDAAYLDLAQQIGDYEHRKDICKDNL